MKSLLTALLASASLAMAMQASAAPVPINLSTWSEKGPPGNGNWIVGGGGAFVTQTINGNPTFFVSPNNFINTNIRGTFAVRSRADNDYIGFVFGYQSPAGTGTNFNFISFDWKQANQFAGSFLASEGFNLTRIDQTTRNYVPCFWGHVDNNSSCDVLGTDYGADRGWADNRVYTFDLLYTTSNINLKIGGGAFGAGTEIFDVTGSFPSGQFGFYNYSQAGVRYSGFTEEAVDPGEPSPVSEPTSLALLGVALGAFALSGRRTRH